MAKKIYVAATSQHVGKTTSTLGLMAAIKNRGYNVGYSKPVGQEFVDLGDLKVDKDALLFSSIMGFDLNENVHSPVILGRGATSAYLDNPDGTNYSQRLLDSVNILNKLHDIIVFEGTGHPGVGSVVDLSNADVAELVGAKVIMIIEGGIGSSIDKMNANLALFREKNIPIIGVVLNKVREDKLEKVKKYVKIKLDKMGIPLLGVVPYDKTLSYPIVETVRHAVNGVVIHNKESLNNRIENVISGALLVKKEYNSLNNLLLIVDEMRVDKSIETIKNLMKTEEAGNPIAGILVHGLLNETEGYINIIKNIEFINDNKIPIIGTTLDTYGSAIKISDIDVKINTRTPWKAFRAINMINEFVDIDYILSKL